MASIATSRRAMAVPQGSLTSSDRHHVLEWYGAALLVFFAVPFLAVNLLSLHHDLYLLFYLTVVGTFVASFVTHTRVDWQRWLRTRMWWSVATGAAVAFAIVRNVMNEAAMPHPSGTFFWFELGWRGVVYGVTDALVLFVFPSTVAYLLVRHRERRRRLHLAALALVLSMGVTATYHLGYPQFRDADLTQPEIGALLANVPTVLTGNPIGSLVVHGSFHVAANVHTYRSEIFLPPELDGYAERGSGSAGVALAAAWILLAGSLIYLERRRLFPQHAAHAETAYSHLQDHGEPT